MTRAPDLGQLFFSPQGALRNGWKCVLFILACGFAGGAFLKVAHLVPGFRAPGNLIPLLLFIPCLLITWAFLELEGSTLATLGLRLNGRWAVALLAGTAGGIVLMGLTAVIIALAGGFHLIRAPGAGTGQLLMGAWAFLGVAIYEEFSFRGYVFQRLERGLGPWGTQIAMAAFFSLAHWGNPGMTGATKGWATLNIALASILLGLCYLKTRSLALPMGVHLGWNWAQGSLLGFGVSGTAPRGFWTPVFHGRPQWLTGGAFGLEASLPCTLVCALACLGLMLVKSKNVSELSIN